VHVVPAFYSPARCSCLVHGVQALFIRMAAILVLAHGLFCELCSRVAACSGGFFLLPVLSLKL
jgi:hypothetical protein